MSDLQISLLAIGAVVIGGVYLFNWFQERQLRRKLGEAFGDDREDVLLRGSTAGGAKVEPQIREQRPREAEEGSDDTLDDAASTPDLPPIPGIDEATEYAAAIDSDGPIPAAAVDELIGKITSCGKPCRGMGFSDHSQAWEPLERGAGDVYTHLRVALQLVNRNGPVNGAQLAAFCDAVRVCGERAGARVSCPDVELALVMARDLDAFCAEVDIAIGINIVTREGDSFTGTKIRIHAEAAGFRLEPDGVFRYRNDQRQTLFTIDNHEPAPFLPEQVKSLTTRGVTLLLDVPRVADGVAVLARMFEVGRSLARALDGSMVDDNRAPLNEAGIAKINQQLVMIQETMHSRGISAGSERALRLFS